MGLLAKAISSFMTRILLIRHGATDLLGRVLYGRMPGVLLNAEGFEQAERLALTLNSRYVVGKVVSSPLDRALQTAQPIAAAAGLPVDIEEGVTEVDVGSWMGKSFAELAALPEWKDYNRYRSITRAPGGESLMQVQDRAWKTLDQVIRHAPPSNESAIALVSHGDVIRALMLLFFGMPIDHLHRLEIAPASVSEVMIDSHGPVVRSVNERLL